MKKLIQFIFSMPLAGIILLVLAGSMAVATFIENDFGTLAARELVYNALWFEVLIFIFAVNLLGSIFKNNMLQRKKYGAFLFHLAFLVIILGATVTRFFGFEGTMMIRERASSDFIYSQTPYIQINIQDQDQQIDFEKRKILSAFSNNTFEKELLINNKTATISLREFIPNPAKTITSAEDGYPAIALVVSGMKGREEYLIAENEIIEIPEGIISFGAEIVDGSPFNIKVKEDSLWFESGIPVVNVNMMLGTRDTLEPGRACLFKPMQLYYYGNMAIVLKTYYPKARISYVSSNTRQGSQNVLLFDVSYQGTTRELAVFGGKGMIGEASETRIEGTNFSISYGPMKIPLDFSLELVDFQLDRYPGSESPSSYASEVILLDERKQLRKPYRIFMNNVLNYDGYRFFQSSYDKDERGTVLSVNHDAAGTWITYIGYALMGLGMIISFFGRSSRFRYLIKASKKVKDIRPSVLALFIIISMFGFTTNVSAQGRETGIDVIEIDARHANNFGELLVQDMGGRIKPMNTLSSELLRKVARKDKLNGLTPDQVVLGMLVYPSEWQSIPMIKVSNPEVGKVIGISGKHASFMDFFDMSGGGSYKLRDVVENAYQKQPAQRNKFDKEIIKVDERINICYMFYNSSILRYFPVPGDPDNRWINSLETEEFPDQEAALFVSGILPIYYDSLKHGVISGNWDPADMVLGYIKAYQDKYGNDVIPSDTKVKMEIQYNKMDIFKRLYQYYGVIGFIMLILVFIKVLNQKSGFRAALAVGFWLLFIGFLFQTYGMVIRWYISGHAPWSNGYESMIYIGWATMLAGLIFSKKSKMSLATTAILTSLVLMTAHHSWMDPQITNLVPVLKSYWLIIHVAIITASYSFLGLGALLGFINLVLMNFKSRKNLQNINNAIRELNQIIEMGLIIGLIMLTIGTFLGGVWANESWGRYWGWDPKETWALITILIYSFVLHMRLIPGLRGDFAFSFASLISFASVLMTYFGVNYYLSGLHSYAQGDPVPVPMFVYYTLIVIAVISIMGYMNNRKFAKP